MISNKNLPIISLLVFCFSLLILPEINKNITEGSYQGMGMCKPKFFEYDVLYFYNPNIEKSYLEHIPTDSVVF